MEQGPPKLMNIFNKKKITKIIWRQFLQTKCKRFADSPYAQKCHDAYFNLI